MSDVPYTVFHPLVGEVLYFFLFFTQPARIVQKQNTQNFYHKQMKVGVLLLGAIHKWRQINFRDLVR